MTKYRRDDQAVDAFSAPKTLLETTKRRAAEKGMTKSGFIRYCLAKEVGWGEEEARHVALHGAVRHLVEGTYPERQENLIMRETPESAKPSKKKASSKPDDAADKLLSEEAGEMRRRAPKSKR